MKQLLGRATLLIILVYLAQVYILAQSVPLPYTLITISIWIYFIIFLVWAVEFDMADWRDIEVAEKDECMFWPFLIFMLLSIGMMIVSICISEPLLLLCGLIGFLTCDIGVVVSMRVKEAK